MSYDLYFCWKKNESLDFERAADWAEGIGNFQRNNQQLWYQNPDTGVYFSLDFETGKFDNPEDNILPSGYFDSGLSFNLNFNRPSFFGHEAMPFVADLARRLELCIFDPQEEEDLALQCEVKIDELTRSWLDNHRSAILTLAQDPEFSRPNIMSLDNSMYFWRYMKAKDELKKACGDLFVPRLMPVKRKGSTEVSIAAAITQDVPSVVPRSDWLFVVREQPGLFSKKTVVVAVTYPEFLDSMAAHVKPFDWRDVPVRVIRQESAKAAGKVLRDLHPTLRRDEFEETAVDSFVDVELSPASLA